MAVNDPEQNLGSLASRFPRRALQAQAAHRAPNHQQRGPSSPVPILSNSLVLLANHQQPLNHTLLPPRSRYPLPRLLQNFPPPNQRLWRPFEEKYDSTDFVWRSNLYQYIVRVFWGQAYLLLLRSALVAILGHPLALR